MSGLASMLACVILYFDHLWCYVTCLAFIIIIIVYFSINLLQDMELVILIIVKRIQILQHSIYIYIYTLGEKFFTNESNVP
jgi:hypothetical protein